MKYYNRTNTCDMCGLNFSSEIRQGHSPLRGYDKKGNWTGNWLCRNCSYEPIQNINNYVRNDKNRTYTEKQLLDYLIRFYNENGKIPKERDFINNVEYPSYGTYRRRFGSWHKALKLAGLDIDVIIKQGDLDNSFKKGRFAEMIVRDHFENKSVDLSRENCMNPCDGICPNGKTYDVKSSKLYIGGCIGNYWKFNTKNKYREYLEYYYFLAFNEDYTSLEYAWRIPGEIVQKDEFYIGMSYAKFNIRNMIEFDITDKLRCVISKKEY